MPDPTGPPARAAATAGVGRRPATTRGQLEQLALELFAAKGFDETSIDDIANAAGIGRRTFFRYFAAKADLVWGDFDSELERLSGWFAAVEDNVPMMTAVRQAVIAFNSLSEETVAAHRLRMSLILGVPTLLADSTLRFVQWREVVAGFAATRLMVPPDHLLPVVVAYSTLGATLAAYEVWLRDGEVERRDRPAELATLLNDALSELALGFGNHNPIERPTRRAAVRSRRVE